MHLSGIDQGAVTQILEIVDKSPHRIDAHDKVQQLIRELCDDSKSLHGMLRSCLVKPEFMNDATNLRFTLYELGDVSLIINLFAPLRDQADGITFDNIHHHGWRLLTTGVISGYGYDFIKFRRQSHESRNGDVVNLKIDENSTHCGKRIDFIDSNTAHVVFHPPRLSATLAFWTADRRLLNQSVKARLAPFPRLRRAAVKIAHATGTARMLGLNAITGTYFYPDKGRIVESQNYSKPQDGSRAEILPCLFKFLQDIKFRDTQFLTSLKNIAPPDVTPWIEKLLTEEPIQDLGIWGDLRRRFSKTQIIQAIEHSQKQKSAA